jgi:hypothetical protein
MRPTMILMVLLVGAGCAGTDDPAPAPEPVPPDAPTAWRDLDPVDYNLLIDRAVAVEAAWPASPLRTVIEAFGDDRDQRSLRIEETKNSGEGATRAAFTVVRDGFLDDSVRGTWTEIELVRQADGTWRVAAARMAQRCWRAPDPAAWTADPCP